MRRPSTLALLVACLVVLAGCNGLGVGTETDTDAPTVTPADVPRDLHGGTVAPGLTEDDVVNRPALFEAHQSVVANRTVVLDVSNRAVHSENGLLSAWNGTVHVAPGRDRTLTRSEREIGGEQWRSAVWYNGSHAVTRSAVGDDEPQFDVQRLDSASYAYYVDQLRDALFEHRNASVTPLDPRDGRERYRVTLHVGSAADSRTTNVSLVVDERGFVERFERTARLPTTENESVSQSLTVEFTPTDRTALDRPGWVGEARETIVAREYVAPGVTTDRVVDGQALSDSHSTLLGGTGVVVRSTERRRAGNGTVLSARNRTVRTTANRTTFVETTVYGGTDTDRDRVDRWSNGSYTYLRTVGENGTTYDDDRFASSSPLDRPWFGYLAEARTTTVTDLGDGRYRVVATDIRAGLAYGTAATTENVSATAVVTADGFVERYEMSYDSVTENGTVTVSESYHYLKRGNVTVDRPDWVGAAVNATG